MTEFCLKYLNLIFIYMGDADNVEVLNLENEICPYTLIQALKKADSIDKELRNGEKKLRILVDHPPVVDNFPAEFKSRGFKVNVEKIDQAKWSVTVFV